MTVLPADITIAGDGELSIIAAPGTTQVLDSGDSFVVTVSTPTLRPQLSRATLAVAHDGANSPTDKDCSKRPQRPHPGDGAIPLANGAGGNVTDTPDWTADTSGAPSTNPDDNRSRHVRWRCGRHVDGTVPAGTPLSIFAQERYDGDGGSEMLWLFSVAAGTQRRGPALFFSEGGTTRSPPLVSKFRRER